MSERLGQWLLVYLLAMLFAASFCIFALGVSAVFHGHIYGVVGLAIGFGGMGVSAFAWTPVRSSSRPSSP